MTSLHWNMRTEYYLHSPLQILLLFLVLKVLENTSETLPLSILMTLTVRIIHLTYHVLWSTIFSELQINFDVDGCDYLKIEEGSTSLEPPIRLQFITNQNPFTVTLTPSSVDTVEALGLGGVFINTFTILPGSRATAGLWTTYFIFQRAFTKS